MGSPLKSKIYRLADSWIHGTKGQRFVNDSPPGPLDPLQHWPGRVLQRINICPELVSVDMGCHDRWLSRGKQLYCST